MGGFRFERRSLVSDRRDWRAAARREHRLEAAGFALEVTPAGKRFWREPETGRRVSGDHAAELVRKSEEQRLLDEGWEPVEVEGETYWRRPGSGRLYPREAAYDLLVRRREDGRA